MARIAAPDQRGRPGDRRGNRGRTDEVAHPGIDQQFVVGCVGGVLVAAASNYLLCHVRSGIALVVDARGDMSAGIFGEMMLTYFRGRGGAGFSTGTKWSFIPQGDSGAAAKPHYGRQGISTRCGDTTAVTSAPGRSRRVTSS